MNQLKIANANNSLKKFGNIQLPVRAAYAVFKLRKVLAEADAFYAQSIREIVEKYRGRFDNRTLLFESPEVCAQAKKELNELNNAEIDIDFDMVEIDLTAINDGVLTPNDIENLEGFITFR